MTTSPSEQDETPEQMSGPDLMSKIAEHASLDTYLDRDPHSLPLTDDELMSLLRMMRSERARWEVKVEKARVKRKTGESDE